MTERAPTLDEAGVSGDVDAILAAATETVKEPDERWKKQSNLVRHGEQKLPERVTVYRRLTGRAVELPTATISQSLRKKAPDGGPAFVRTAAQAVTPPPFIKQECEVCTEVYGKPKRFHKAANYRSHMARVHELEWDEMRETAAEERQNQQTAALLALAEKGITNAPAQKVTRRKADSAEGGIPCPDCGKICASAFGLRAHQRSHQEAPVS